MSRRYLTRGPMLSLLLIPLMLAALPLEARASYSADELPESDRPLLIGIEPGPDEGTYTLICEGDFQHRVVPDAEGLLLTVELQGVVNAIPADSLPDPHGLIRYISVADDGRDLTRVAFALTEPVPAVASVNGRGLTLQFGGEAPPAPQAKAADDPAAAERILELAGGELTVTRDQPADDPVGAEDLLEISVFEIPELNRTLRVSANGRISLPLLGEMHVGGLTPTELEAKLRGALAERYLQDPQVSVFVRQHASRTVSVLGAVGKPGVYEMLGPRTLLQVLSLAGGLTDDAGAELYVIRTEPENSGERIVVDVNDLMASRDPSLNLGMEPGDIVSVPIDRHIYIYVDGAVRNPGRIEQLSSRPITLLQAVAKAGGATERANLKGIQILRQTPDGMQKIMQMNLKRIREGKDQDPVLQDGDIVVVPETFF